jgi:hypothetical protein
MSGAGDRPVHKSASEWAAEHLVDADGRPLELQPWQREVLERVVDGRGAELVITTPRGPDRDRTSLAAPASVMELGDVAWTSAGSRAQARRVFAEARRLVLRR